MPLSLRLLAPALLGASTTTALAQEVLALDPVDGPAMISPEGADTNKVKMLLLPDGTYVAVYGLAQDVGHKLYDVKSRKLRDPYDIVVSTSTDKGKTWSTPLNISNTAALSSSKGVIEPVGEPPLDGDGHPDMAIHPNAVDWPGDSDKPNAFNAGTHILVTWTDKYCDAAEQRFVVYPELNGIAVPYSCVYASRLKWNATAKAFVQTDGLPYITERLTSGERDAKSDANKGANAGFVVNWQEDPQGLQLGGGDGPGDGASGAKVTHGTDVWYTWIDTAANTDFLGPDWAEPVRVTPNAVNVDELHGGMETTTHPYGLYDAGYVGSSRPNIALIGSTTIITYEETKGTLGWDEGKYVRYHTFPFTSPPSEGVGCIISKPEENARRVRILTQPLSAGQTSVVFIYKQGEYTEGGPSDIMMRRLVGGLDPASMVPAIDADNCRTSRSVDTDPLEALADPAKHTPAVNFSGSEMYLDPTGMAPNATTGANDYENALAHRGLIRGDLVVVGYSYTPDLYRFTYLGDAEPYDFYVRSSKDGGATWSEPYNLSNLSPESGLTVREPRIVPTPSSYDSCATKPANCQNPDVFWVGFGLQENKPIQEEVHDVDVYMTLSVDGGSSYFTPQALTFGDAINGLPDAIPDFETQLKMNPSGTEAGIVWSSEIDGKAEVAFRRAVPSFATAQVDLTTGDKGTVTVVSSTTPVLTVTPGAVTDVTDEPLPADAPFGALDIDVTGIDAGATVDVYLGFEDPLPEDAVVWVFAPSEDDATAHWHTVDATVDGTYVRFPVVDGDDLDDDGAEDAAISTWAVIGTEQAPPPATDSGDTGDVGDTGPTDDDTSDGCGCQSTPTSGFGFLALLALGGVIRRRRR